MPAIELKLMAQMTPEERLALSQEETSARLAALEATGFKLPASGLGSLALDDVRRLETFEPSRPDPARPFSWDIGLLMARAVGG